MPMNAPVPLQPHDPTTSQVRQQEGENTQVSLSANDVHSTRETSGTCDAYDGWFNEATWQFIEQYRHERITDIALRTKPNAQIDQHGALQYIDGWQRAEHKLPLWAATSGIIFPVKLSMEQCSSQQTAHYKQQVIASIIKYLPQDTATQRILVDLTGGFGVDTTMIAPVFDAVTMVERNSELATIAQHNMRVFGLTQVQVRNEDAHSVVQQMRERHQQATCIMIDPARRDTAGARTYAIADCTPNIIEMMPDLLEIAPIVMVKLSPMLDWHKAVADMPVGVVQAVHIVAVDRECKELLLIIMRPECAAQYDVPPTLHIAHIQHEHTQVDRIVFTSAHYEQYALQETHQTAQYSAAKSAQPIAITLDWLSEHIPQLYLYEPHAAMMKAGCFDYVQQHYEVQQLAANSHLFVSTTYRKDFPGKVLQVVGVSTSNKKQLRTLTSDLTHANISVRNFPQSVATLRKSLRVLDGGTTTLYATSLSDRTHIVLRAQIVEP